MRPLRTLTCATLLLAILGVAPADGARADTVAGFDIGSLPPQTDTSPPDVGVYADPEGDFAYLVEGVSDDRTQGDLYAEARGAGSSTDVGTPQGNVVVSNGWLAFEIAPTRANSVSVRVYNFASGSTTDEVLPSGDAWLGIAGDGRQIIQQPTPDANPYANDDQIAELLNSDGTTTTLATSTSGALVVADGSELVMAVSQSDGSWVMDHVTLGEGSPTISQVGTVAANETPTVFMTPQTYGWAVTADATVHWVPRGSEATPSILTLSSSEDLDASTDGTTVVWRASDGLGTSPINALSTRTVLPYSVTYGGSLTAEGLVFAGANSGSDLAVHSVTTDGTDAALDSIGPGAQPVFGVAVSQGQVLRWYDGIERTSLNGPAEDQPAGDTSDLLPDVGYRNGSLLNAAPLLSSGQWTVVPAPDGGDSFTAYDGNTLVFTSPDDLAAEVTDLHGSDLVYTTFSESDRNVPVVQHVRDLATGVDVPTTFRGIGGGGLLSDRGYDANDDLVVFQEAEIPGAGLTSVTVPPTVCPQPSGLLLAAYRTWVEVTCSGTPTVIDTLALKAYPMVTGAKLGDGVLVWSTYSCVNVRILLSGSPATCIPIVAGGATTALDDTGGGLVAWSDAAEAVHIARVLGDDPQVGAAVAPQSITNGQPWSISLPVSVPTTWTLTLFPAGTMDASPFAQITGSATSGGLTATWDGKQGLSGTSLADGVQWTLVAVTNGQREVGASGLFHDFAPHPVPQVPLQPSSVSAAKAPHLLYSLGRVKTLRGVTQLKHGNFSLVTSAAGSAGCVKVLLQRLVGKKWKTVSTSRCLAANKRTTTKEKLATTGSYRLEVIWSLAATKPLKIIPIRAF